mgnify:FL=1|jgi:hypothetical protein
MPKTGNKDQDVPETTEEENNDPALQPEPDVEKNAPAPSTTTVPRIKPT